MVDKTTLDAQIAAELAKFEDVEGSKPEITETKAVAEEAASEGEATGDSEVTEAAPSESSAEDVLKEAISMGYDPEYKGPNRKSPEQFVKDGSFFKKINEQKKEIQEVKNLLKQQMEHTKKVERAAAEKHLLQAQQEKLDSVNEGDVAAFKLAEQKEKIIQEQLQQYQPVAEAVPEEVTKWAKENEAWFNKNTKENTRMAMTADALFRLSEQEALDEGIQRTTQDHLKFVDERIRGMFPTKFENPETKRPAMVAKSTAGGSGKTSIESKLSNQQRQFVKDAQRRGCPITMEEYAKQLQLTGELRND